MNYSNPEKLLPDFRTMMLINGLELCIAVVNDGFMNGSKIYAAYRLS